MSYRPYRVLLSAAALAFLTTACPGTTSTAGDGDGGTAGDGDGDGINTGTEQIDRGDGDGDGDGLPVGDGDGDGDSAGDGDGDGDGTGDGDGDGDQPFDPNDVDGDNVPNDSDNCPDDANTNQADLDSDGIGNACDDDQDGDGYNNDEDCAPFEPTINPGAEEIPDNTYDENCDSIIEGNPMAGGGPSPQCGMNCMGTDVDALLCAMEICYPDYQGAASIETPHGGTVINTLSGNNAIEAIEHFGDASNDLAPIGPSYMVMSTGLVGGSNLGSPGNDTLFGASSGNDAFSPGDTINDVVEFHVTLTAPEGVAGFSIDYIFMSQEYEEYIGTDFNDKFYILMNGVDTTGGQDQIINFTACSDPDTYFDFETAELGAQCYIAINTAFSEPCTNVATDISGTGYQCAAPGDFSFEPGGSSTGWLRTTWTVTGGETFTLKFHIHDTADAAFDSLVLLDNFQWLGGNVKPGTEGN